MIVLFDVCSEFSNFLYRYLYKEPIHVPFDYERISMADVEEFTKGLLRKMYDGDIPFTYENFDNVCSGFEYALSLDYKNYAKSFKCDVNTPCICGSGKKFKKCHGGVINCRPTHI